MFFGKEDPSKKIIKSLGKPSALVFMDQMRLFTVLLEILIEKEIIAEKDFKGRTKDPIESGKKMAKLLTKLGKLTFEE